MNMNYTTDTYPIVENTLPTVIVTENTTYDPLLIGVFISDFASPFVRDGVTITVYTCIFVIGLIFNAVVCLVISCRKSMHTTTGCYILNLSISDLVLVIVGAPDEAYDQIFHFSEQTTDDGDLGCFLRTWAGETSASVSTMIVTVFTVERYLAICHPFVAHVMSDISRVIKLVIVIWVIALLSSLPLARQADFFQYDLDDGAKTGSCFYNVKLSSYPMDISTMAFFIVPMTIITLMHILIGIKLLEAARMRKTVRQMRTHVADDSTNKALKLLVAIVVTFFLCWAPVRMQRWLYIHFGHLHEDKYWYFSLLPFYARIFCLLSSILNPVIYSIMSKKFREAFMDLFVRSVCRKKCCRNNKHKVAPNTTTSGNGNTSYSRGMLTNVEL